MTDVDCSGTAVDWGLQCFSDGGGVLRVRKGFSIGKYGG